MEFSQLIKRAQDIRQDYSLEETKRYGRSWSGEELLLGYMKDMGDLAKLVQAKEGVRQVDDVDNKLAHELSDCLWSIIVLAKHYDVDLEASFLKTMDELEARLKGAS